MAETAIVQPGEPTDGVAIGRRLRAEGKDCGYWMPVVVQVENSPGDTRSVAWFIFRAGFQQFEPYDGPEAFQSAVTGELGRTLG